MRPKPFILSLVAHAAMIGTALAVRILATPALPDPPRSTSFMMARAAAPVRQPPSAPQQQTSTRATKPNPAPVEAPAALVPSLHDLPDVPPEGAGAILGGGDPVGDLAGTLPPLPPQRVGGHLRAPEKVYHVPPVYPAVAQSARVTGTVILEALITEDGSVADVTILRSVALLDAAAVEAVRQWRYTPTLLNGIPVRVIMSVTVTFVLK